MVPACMWPCFGALLYLRVALIAILEWVNMCVTANLWFLFVAVGVAVVGWLGWWGMLGCCFGCSCCFSQLALGLFLSQLGCFEFSSKVGCGPVSRRDLDALFLRVTGERFYADFARSGFLGGRDRFEVLHVMPYPACSALPIQDLG